MAERRAVCGACGRVIVYRVTRSAWVHASRPPWDHAPVPPRVAR
jgi:hypothetical protein